MVNSQNKHYSQQNERSAKNRALNQFAEIPVTIIPARVSIKYQMLDNESAHAVYDLLTDEFSNVDSVSLNEQENSLLIEGGDSNVIGELLETNLDGETFSKVTKVSTLYKGHPIELISERNVRNFQTVLEKLRHNARWLKKHGLRSRNSMNVSVSNAAIGYFLVTVQPEKESEKPKAGIIDYKGETILPFIDYEREQTPEEAVDLNAEILRRVETMGIEKVDPLDRIRVDGESVPDKERQGVIYPLTIDQEAKGFLLVPNKNRKDFQMWLTPPGNGKGEGMEDATNDVKILLGIKDKSYCTRVITEEVNVPLDEYIEMEAIPKHRAQSPITDQLSEGTINKTLQRMANIRIEERGELLEKWLSAEIDGSPVLSEKLTEKEYRNVKEGSKTEQELAFEHFGHYLEKGYEKEQVTIRPT